MLGKLVFFCYNEYGDNVVRKKISWTIDDEERIKMLVNSVKDSETIVKIYGASIKQIRHFLHVLPPKSFSELDEDYWIRMAAARTVAKFVMAAAVKEIISEDNYKNIALSFLPGNIMVENGRTTCGQQFIENGKSVNAIYLNSIEALASGNLVDFLMALTVFAHELYHTKQYFDSKSGKLTISNLIYCLEKIAYSSKDEYQKNYDNIFYEQEADFFGVSHSYSFIKIFDDKDIDKTKYINTFMSSKKNWQNLLFDFKTQCNYVKELLSIIDSKNIKRNF